MRSLIEKLWIRGKKNIIFFIFIFYFFIFLLLQKFLMRIYTGLERNGRTKCYIGLRYFFLQPERCWRILQTWSLSGKDHLKIGNPRNKYIIPLLYVSVSIHFFFSVLVISLLLYCTGSKFHKDKSVCFYYIRSNHSKPSSKSLKVLLEGLTF